MIDDHEPASPAFYALGPSRQRRRWADWWVVLHPPYTVWHLSYVVIGAAVAPEFSGVRLTATLVAFFLAVGLAAHALDELHDRPLGTTIPSRQLIVVATAALAGAVVVGIVGLARVGPGLAIFVVAGVILTCGYNLELFGGRLHNDISFAFAWGAFPVLTAYYAQAETLRLPALLAAGFAFWLSAAQRALSSQARTLRRRVTSVEGTLAFRDGTTRLLSRSALLTPIETALKATSWSVFALAAALVVYRAMATG
jgi:hypothetical protein